MKQKTLHKFFMLPLLAAALLMPQRVAAIVSPTPVKIAVVSDIHVMAPSLLPDGAKDKSTWTNYYNGQRKMLVESAALFDQFVADMITAKPDIVLITGDLTKDGELVSHEYVREKLATLKAQGIQVFVIPGNHDFGEEGNHKEYHADNSEPTDVPVLTTGNFATFYNNYGYGDDADNDPNSLSYVVEPVPGLILLAIDSHTATLSDATLSWLCTKADVATSEGKQVIAMMHHPLFPHIAGANFYIDTYQVNGNGYKAVRNALISAGVKVILTGHFHTSDIAYDWNDDPANGIYDINTGSLISYPCDYRIMDFSADRKTLSLSTASITQLGENTTFNNTAKAFLEGRLATVATTKLGELPYNMIQFTDEDKNYLIETVVSAFILHAEGDENTKVAAKALLDDFDDSTGGEYSSPFNYTTAKRALSPIFHSILEDKSNYGDEHVNQTADRTLDLVNTSASGWATYCTGHDLDISLVDGLKAYVVSGTTTTSATLTEVTEIPVGAGFLLKGDANTQYMLKPATTAVDPITTNLLKGTLEPTIAVEGNYVLANDGTTAGFFPVKAGVSIPAHKAYLANVSSGARMLIIDGDATGIRIVEADEGDQTIYTLQGIRAGSLHRGLYIMNGKKIIIK